MNCFSLENQMFLLQAIKDTNDSFEDEYIYEEPINTGKSINELFNVLENMENKLEELTSQNS